MLKDMQKDIQKDIQNKITIPTFFTDKIRPFYKIACVQSNQSNNCYNGQLIPDMIYDYNIKNKTPEQIQKYVCGSTNSWGINNIRACCDPFDPSANDIVEESQNLIRTIHDDNGKYKSINVCKCLLDDKKCIDKYCENFKKPTQFERCKSIPNDASKIIQVNPFVYNVLPDNSFENCYAPCTK